MAAPDQFANGNFARRHHPVERGRHRRVAEVDLGGLNIRLRLEHIRARGVAVGARLVEIGLGRNVLGLQLLLTRELGFGVDQRRLGAFRRRLRLLQLHFVGLRLDDE